MPQPVSIPARRRPKRRLALVQIGFQQPQGPVVAPVEEVELLTVLVEKEEEGVTQLVHLLPRLVVGHGAHLEALDLRHPVRPDGGVLRGSLADGGGLGATMVFWLFLVLAG